MVAQFIIFAASNMHFLERPNYLLFHFLVIARCCPNPSVKTYFGQVCAVTDVLKKKFITRFIEKAQTTLKRKKFYRLRCSIEAKISLAKRKFGMDLIKYRIDGAEEMWIRLGLMAMNLKAAVNTS